MPPGGTGVGRSADSPGQEQGRVVLLVEDDRTISDLLAYNLRRAGFRVLQEWNGRAGVDRALKEDVDLVLMDLMLPALDGMTATKEILRRKPKTPIIVLTARDERETILEGFETGAADYVVKPFDMDVLLARIQARLRATHPSGSAIGDAPRTLTGAGDLVLDADAHVLRTPQGEVALNPKEHDLLELLLSRPGHLFPREEIVTAVWHHQYMPASRSLDVHVRRLRTKLESIEAAAHLETVRGVGYRIVT